MLSKHILWLNYVQDFGFLYRILHNCVAAIHTVMDISSDMTKLAPLSDLLVHHIFFAWFLLQNSLVAASGRRPKSARHKSQLNVWADPVGFASLYYDD